MATPYWLNNTRSGARIQVASYDAAISILEFVYENKYSIKADTDLSGVWWISLTDAFGVEHVDMFMLTNYLAADNVKG